MNKIIKIDPVLSLRGLKNGELTGYTDKRISDLLKNINSFPGLKPAPMDLNDINEQYKEALSAPRSQSNTSRKKRIRRALEIILMRCAGKCAQIAEGNLSIYLLSGFDYKRKRGVDYSKFPIENLRVEIGKEEGELLVKFKTVKNAKSYEVEYGLHDAPYNSWLRSVTASCGKILIEDLESGIHYKIRVRGVFGNNRYSPWSQTIVKKTY